MAEFPPSPVSRSRHGSWLHTLTAVLGILVVGAIAKPWAVPGSVEPSFAAGTPGGVAAEPLPSSVRGTYDPRLFGNKEPDPAWELWPAGFVVQFGMAGPVPVHSDACHACPSQPSPSPSPSPHRPRGSAPATAAPSGRGLPDAGPVIDLGAADHLIALGINTPTDVQVTSIELDVLRDDGCCEEAVPLIRLPTLWESRHFFVIGIDDPRLPGQPGAWPIGEYRLYLGLRSGETRSVAFRVT